jgi:antirestriction protein ArdC
MDIHAIVTEKIINLLETGIVPWRRPWTSTGLPRNLVSKKPSRCVNVFLLSASKYVSSYWLTLRQANELCGHVRKGEESTLIVYWKVDDVKQCTEDLDAEETEEKTRRRILLRHYRVFNLEQCELPQAVIDKLLIHAAAQAQRAADYSLNRPSRGLIFARRPRIARARRC